MNSPLDIAPYAHGTKKVTPSGVFAFQSRSKKIETSNARAIAPGTNATLDKRLKHIFSQMSPHQAIVGAMPFHYDSQPDSLWLADTLIHDPQRHPQTTKSLPNWQVRAAPRAEDYAQAVFRALDCLTDKPRDKDDLTKIVLARCIEAECDHNIDLTALFHRLSIDPSINVFQVALPQKGPSPRYMIGASPELLVSKYGDQIASRPRAGSARRQT